MWKLTKVTRLPRTGGPPALGRLLQTVEMEFKEFDGNGVVVNTHLYTEPNVSDVSDAGIARLARDQMRQLQKISDTPAGEADLAAIAALMEATPTEPPEPDPDAEKRAELTADLRQLLGQMRAIEIGIMKADDAEVAALKAKLDTALKEDRDLVLSLIR